MVSLPLRLPFTSQDFGSALKTEGVDQVRGTPDPTSTAFKDVAAKLPRRPSHPPLLCEALKLRPPRSAGLRGCGVLKGVIFFVISARKARPPNY